jgi:hypothetical protein
MPLAACEPHALPRDDFFFERCDGGIGISSFSGNESRGTCDTGGTRCATGERKIACVGLLSVSPVGGDEGIGSYG